jgi:AhpD family alkylhydroperoxidase
MKSQRIDYGKVAPGTLKAMLAADAHFNGASISQILRRLIELRVSQINGCAYCIWLHTKQARDLGEADGRLAAVAGWRDTDCFDDAERSALEWAEAVTRISNGPPSDALYNNMRSHFDDCLLVELTAIIANMNAMNRLAISFHHEPPSE